jgi:zinc protease
MRTLVATVVAASLLLPIASVAQEQPPAPSAPREARVPQPVEKTLPNGLRVIVVEKHDVPLVAARLMVMSGGEADAAGLAGLAQATAGLLTKGTRTRSAEQIANGVAALGATLQAEAAWDSSNVDVSVMSTKLSQAFEYMADVVRHPTFAAEEIERARQQNLDALSVEMQSPRSLAAFVATKVLFEETPYGHYIGGTPESLKKIARADIVRFYDRYYRPDNAVLIIGGDVKPAAAFALAETRLGGWPKPSTPKPASDPQKLEKKTPRVVVVDMPDAGQASVVVTLPAMRRVDPAYHSALVTNSVLGGGYSSRLNQEIRIKRGLSYGAGSAFRLRRDAGSFVARAETKNESADEVADLLMEELAKLGTTDIADVELTPRKAVLIGEFGRSLETSAGLVDSLSELALYGLPLDEINRYIGSVQKVTAADVRSFAAGRLAGAGASVVIVGDAKKFLDALKPKYPNIEVIPIGELDLNTAKLRK